MSQQPFGAEGKRRADGEMSMQDIWAAAATSFESICGESLQKGDIQSFDDVARKIENSDADAALDGGWGTAKRLGLKSLEYLKILVGAASCWRR